MWYNQHLTQQEIQLVKNYFKNLKRLGGSSFKRFFKLNPKLKQKLEKLNLTPKLNLYIRSILQEKPLPYCKICGKPCLQIWFQYCSKQCQYKDQSNINNTIKHNTKQIFQKKYGVDNPGQLDWVKQKIKQTNLKNTGCINPFQRQDVKQKIRETNKQRYGYDYYMQIPEVKAKATAKMKQTYASGKVKIIQPKLLDKSWQKIQLWKDFIIPCFTRQQWYGGNCKYIYKWKCQLCGHEFQTYIHCTRHIKGQQYSYMPRCLHCFPLMAGKSKKQKQIIKFCRQYFPNLEENYRHLIWPYQVDIYIQQINLAIEFNGSFWHQYNNQYGVKPNYHLNKTKLCNQKNVRLIHIWQDQWDDNKQEIKQNLYKIFKNQQKIPLNVQLDFSWFNNIKDYQIQKITSPKIIKRGDYLVQDCGNVIFRK